MRVRVLLACILAQYIHAWYLQRSEMHFWPLELELNGYDPTRECREPNQGHGKEQVLRTTKPPLQSS